MDERPSIRDAIAAGLVTDTAARSGLLKPDIERLAKSDGFRDVRLLVVLRSSRADGRVALPADTIHLWSLVPEETVEDRGYRFTYGDIRSIYAFDRDLESPPGT